MSNLPQVLFLWMSVFSTRELALLIWILVVFIFSLFSENVRDSYKRILKALELSVLVIIMCMVVYVSSIIYVLTILKTYPVYPVKDILFWIFLVGFPALLKINKIRYEKDYYKKTIKISLKWTILLEFIIGLYTFNLAKELIIVPIAFLIGGMTVVAKRNAENERVYKLLYGLASICGLLLVIYIIREMYLDPYYILNINSLRLIFITPILTISFLPFIFILSVYIYYENRFVALKQRITNKSLLLYAKKNALIRFNFDKDGLSRWINRLYTVSPVTRNNIDSSIDYVKKRQNIEKDPPTVSLSVGWSPFLAGSTLTDFGLKAGHYENRYQDEWHSMSSNLLLNGDLLKNSIVYYVIGTDLIATRLELIFKVQDPNYAQIDFSKYCIIASILYRESFQEEMFKEIEESLFNCRTVKLTHRGKEILLEKVDHVNGGFDYYFIIQNISKRNN